MKKIIRNMLYPIGFFLYFSRLYKIIIYLRRHRKRILIYHDIDNNKNSFLEGLNISITTKAFEKQMKFLKRHYNVSSLQMMISAIEMKKKTDRMVAITFDDGYKSFMNNALPVLKEFQYPATVFIIGKCLHDDYVMWRNRMCFFLNTNFHFTRDYMKTFVGHFQHRHIAPYDTLSKKEMIVQSAQIAKFMKPHEIERLLSNLSKLIEIPQSELYLNVSDCKRLSREGIDFGNHSYSHYEFNYLDKEEVREETRLMSSNIMEDIDYKNSWLALPRGRPLVNSEILDIAKYSGIRWFFCSNGLDNDENASPYSLGRQHLTGSKEYELFTEMELLPLFRNLKILLASFVSLNIFNKNRNRTWVK